MIELHPERISAENFASYGEVIEAAEESTNQMNGTFARFDDVALIESLPFTDSAEVPKSPSLSVVRSQRPAQLPYQFNLVECHPLCSQAFIPLNHFAFYVVVAPAGETVHAKDLRAFVTNGRQGISYRPGTWHMPLIAIESGQEFLVVDQASRQGNLREHQFDEAITLVS